MKNEYGENNNPSLDNKDRLEYELLIKMATNNKLESSDREAIIKHGEVRSMVNRVYSHLSLKPNY